MSGGRSARAPQGVQYAPRAHPAPSQFQPHAQAKYKGTLSEARSLRSQRINGNYIVSGCDFSEHKDTAHIARALSFERKPSIRSFRVSQTPSVIVEPPPRGPTALVRTNAVKLGPLQYIRHVFARMRMRMRLRRKSPVLFRHQNFARKRSYLLDASTSSYQYRVRSKDLFKFQPQVLNYGVSAPFNAMHGAKALAAAERGKNYTFNIQTTQHPHHNATISVPVGHKQLPRRASKRPSASTRASLILPEPPKVGSQSNQVGGQLNQVSETEYDDLDDLPELVPSQSTRKPRFTAVYAAPQRQPAPASRGERSHPRDYSPSPEDENEPIDIEDALEFVNAWGSYLQKMVASRVFKDRQAKLQELREEERYLTYQESDDSSVYSDEVAHGVYESCTSECFAHSDQEDNTESTLRTNTEPSPLPPMPPPHVPTRTTSVRANVRAKPISQPASVPRPVSRPISTIPPRSTTPPQPRRKVSGPRAMRSQTDMPPLQITPRQMTDSHSSLRHTPPISVICLQTHPAASQQQENEFDFSSGGEQIDSSWVANSASPASKSSKRLSRHNAVVYNSLTPSHPRHSPTWSRSSSESESAQLLTQYTDPLMRWSSSEDIAAV